MTKDHWVFCVTKDKLIKDYKEAKENYDKLADQVMKYFMPKVKRALKKKNLEEATKITRKIPDHITQCFAIDAILQVYPKFKKL